jgi:hypothetical protein
MANVFGGQPEYSFDVVAVAEDRILEHFKLRREKVPWKHVFQLIKISPTNPL